MNERFENFLYEWPLNVIKDVDIATIINDNHASKRYATVNRALKKGILISLRRGVYLISKRFRKSPPSHFQLAHTIYGPSYISFESALFYHQWIPETVYTTTCATAKRSKEFDTPVGIFKFMHVPEHLCYLGVQRVGNENESFFIADPWKALADHYYVYKRNWNRLEDLHSDMRIEVEDMQQSDLNALKILSEHYQSKRVRQFLQKILKELINGNQNN